VSRLSAVYHQYEDALQTIEINFQIKGIYEVALFDENLTIDPAHRNTTIYISVLPPAQTCGCASRAAHCSTAVDSCVPTVPVKDNDENKHSTPDGGETMIAYWKLWQYLVEPDRS
jgi:hypothetical protein